VSDYSNDAVGYAKLVVDLEKKIRKQEQEIKDLKGIIDVQSQMKIPLSVVKQVADQQTKIDTLHDDIKYYKRFVPKNVISERENKGKPTRGSLSSNFKDTKVSAKKTKKQIELKEKEVSTRTSLSSTLKITK